MATKHPATTKHPAKKKTAGRAALATKVGSVVQRRPVHAAVLKRPLPAKSVAKAKKAFKKFSLSRFSKTTALPRNFVPAAQAKNAAAVRLVQRKHMAHSLSTVQKVVPVNPGMSLSLPAAMIKTLLPSLKAAAGTVDLGEVIALLQSRMPGTEFYANGNPALSRLATHSQLQAQAQSIIDGIKAARPKK
jgi:hypothetical protein